MLCMTVIFLFVSQFGLALVFGWLWEQKVMFSFVECLYLIFLLCMAMILQFFFIANFVLQFSFAEFDRENLRWYSCCGFFGWVVCFTVWLCLAVNFECGKWKLYFCTQVWVWLREVEVWVEDDCFCMVC